MEEQLKQLMKEAVEEALATFTPQSTIQVPDIMTSAQVAEYMQVSESWVRKNMRRLPRLNVVGARYRKVDIDKWLDDNVIPSSDNLVGKVSKGTTKSKSGSVYKVI
ncbi:MAG: helix-turn-helix domain-containing protein [Niameybacter sp.]